ncbi:MAG: twin-arginine translocase TatA/TatE family subunit [Bryobacteraceae bacterium]
MGPLGWQETVFIFVLALLIFGPKKLPELGKTIGKALTEFRRASSELKSTWDREMSNLERENESIREVTSSVHGELQDYSSSYTYEQGPYDLPQEDSAAASPSTVSASAPEGADQTTDSQSEPVYAAAEAASESAGCSPEFELADSGQSAGVAEGEPSPESRTVAG